MFRHLVERFEPSKLKLFDDLKFGWSYTANLKSRLYKPYDTFLNFEAFGQECICTQTPRLGRFLKDIPLIGKHVLTTDMDICGNKAITNMLYKGFNHIPTRDIHPHEAFCALWDGWIQVTSLLNF